MKTEAEVQAQKDAAYDELNRILSSMPVGSGAWRRQKGYIDALEWVLQ